LEGDPFTSQEPGSVEYPSEEIKRRSKRLEQALLAIMLALVAGRLSESAARKRAYALIRQSLDDLTRDVVKHYRQAGLKGPLPKRAAAELAQLRARIEEETEKILTAPAREDFWSTSAGVTKSVGLLALLVTYGVVGQITVIIARWAKRLLMWWTRLDPEVCESCERLHGKTFNPLTDVLPNMPLHLGGRCRWIIVGAVK